MGAEKGAEEKVESKQSALTRPEYLKLLAACKERKNRRFYLVIKLIGGAGLRPQEVLNLTVEAVRQGVVSTDLDTQQTVCLPRLIQRELLDYAAENQILSGLMFTTRRGKPLNYDWVRHNITLVAMEAGVWSVWNIKEILRDEVYLGRLVQGKRTQESYKQARAERYAPPDEWRVAENTHEALVDEKTFTAVRELADRRAAKAQSNQGKADDLKTPNIFRKLIYCADCGKAMVRRHIYNRRAGSRFYYYSFQCRTTQNAVGVCTPKNLKEPDLIAAVSDTVRRHLDAVSELEKQVAEKWTAKISDTEQEVMRQIADAERELALSETRVDGLYQSLVSGVIDREEYLNLKRHYMAQCAEKKERLNDWKHKLQEIKRCSPSNPLFAAFQKFKGMDGLTEELTHTLISRIDVHDNGRIDIKLTYQDEIHHLLRSLEEVAAA